jgi:hypothetical protein
MPATGGLNFLPLVTFGDPIASPSGDDVSSPDDTVGGIRDFLHEGANAVGNVVRIEDLFHTAVV